MLNGVLFYSQAIVLDRLLSGTFKKKMNSDFNYNYYQLITSENINKKRETYVPDVGQV